LSPCTFIPKQWKNLLPDTHLFMVQDTIQCSCCRLCFRSSSTSHNVISHYTLGIHTCRCVVAIISWMHHVIKNVISTAGGNAVNITLVLEYLNILYWIVMTLSISCGLWLVLWPVYRFDGIWNKYSIIQGYQVLSLIPVTV
jgi:hypothetical protein